MFDLVLIDVDHSPDEPLGPQSAHFYSEPGLRAAREHVAPGGLLGVWSYAASPEFAATLRRVFDEAGLRVVRREVQSGLPRQVFRVVMWALSPAARA